MIELKSRRYTMILLVKEILVLFPSEAMGRFDPSRELERYTKSHFGYQTVPDYP